MITILRFGVSMVLLAAWFGPAAAQNSAGQALNPFLGNFVYACSSLRLCDCIACRKSKFSCKACRLCRQRLPLPCRARRPSRWSPV